MCQAIARCVNSVENSWWTSRGQVAAALRNEYRLQRFLRIRLEQVAQLLPHLFCIDIADNHEGEIVRHVTRFVILHHLLLRKLVVDLQLADDRKPVGMPLIRRPKKQQARHAIGIVHAHRELAPDDFLLFLVFLRRQSGIHHSVAQPLQRDADPIFRHVDPKNRPIKRGIGVDVTPDVLDALRNLIGRLRFCSFEEHVLENVGQPRAKMLVFIDASGGAPRLHARHRRAVVLLHDHGEAVWQNPFLRRARRKRNQGRRIQVVQPSN